MNINELKQNWEALYGEPSNVHNEADIRRLIASGTSEEVSQINRKLFRDMLITGVATIVSVVGVIFFYVRYDPVEQPWIDISKLIPIQLLAFSIFLALFFFGYAEYRIVNRKFTANSLRNFLSATVRKNKTYYWIFTTSFSVLLFTVYLLEINYFVNPHDTTAYLFTTSGALTLTGVSYLAMRYYYRSHFATHFQRLEDYQNELSS